MTWRGFIWTIHFYDRLDAKMAYTRVRKWTPIGAWLEARKIGKSYQSFIVKRGRH